MSTISSLFLLLCLSMHACNARHLRIIDEKPRTEVHSSGMVDARSLSLPSRSLSDVEKTSSLHKELQDQNQEIEKGESRTNEIPSGASSEKPNASKVPPMKVEDNKETSSGGDEIIVSSSYVGLQQATVMEGSERRARSVLGSGSHFPEETLDSKENDVDDEDVVMDYEQPHRKPPIHNRET